MITEKTMQYTQTAPTRNSAQVTTPKKQAWQLWKISRKHSGVHTTISKINFWSWGDGHLKLNLWNLLQATKILFNLCHDYGCGNISTLLTIQTLISLLKASACSHYPYRLKYPCQPRINYKGFSSANFGKS